MNEYSILYTLVLRLRVQTLDKLKERALCFIYYCKNVKNIVDLSLALFNNTNFYIDCLEYPEEQPKHKPSSFKPYNCCFSTLSGIFQKWCETLAKKTQLHYLLSDCGRENAF